MAIAACFCRLNSAAARAGRAASAARRQRPPRPATHPEPPGRRRVALVARIDGVQRIVDRDLHHRLDARLLLRAAKAWRDQIGDEVPVGDDVGGRQWRQGEDGNEDENRGSRHGSLLQSGRSVGPNVAPRTSGLLQVFLIAYAAFASGVASSASASTSATELTMWNVMCSRTSLGTSSRSAALRSGTITSVSPAACAASTFCLSPPIGSTRPCSVTSPVMPIVLLTGRLVSSDAIAVTIVTPALGPSFGIAPAGTCTCTSRPSSACGSMPSSDAWLFT